MPRANRFRKDISFVSLFTSSLRTIEDTAPFLDRIEVRVLVNIYHTLNSLKYILMKVPET